MKTYKVTVYSDKNICWYNEAGQFDREDGPAVECANGYKEWYVDGKRHRADGPAVEWSNGSKSWYLDGKLHRADGPAVECSNGTKYWYLDGKLHRADGPAVECSNGTKYWYLDDKGLTEKEFNLRMNPPSPTCEGKQVVIDGKTYVLREVI